MSEEPPLYPLPIVGWKIFTLNDKGQLTSLYRSSFIWHYLGHKRLSEDPSARCDGQPLRLPKTKWCLHPEAAPGEGCQCGFWAYCSPERACEDPNSGANLFRLYIPVEKFNPSASWVQRRGVLALVQGYGRWFANEISWRAERVRIAALTERPGPFGVKVAQLASEIEVPLLNFEEISEFAPEAGMEVGGV